MSDTAETYRFTADDVCELCFPDVTFLGQVAGLVVVRSGAGQVLVLAGQLHAGDELFVFDHEPLVDPSPTVEQVAEVEAAGGSEEDLWDVTMSDEFDAWMVAAECTVNLGVLVGKCSMSGVASVVADASADGWDADRDGFLELWLYNQVALLAAARPSTSATIDAPSSRVDDSGDGRFER